MTTAPAWLPKELQHGRFPTSRSGYPPGYKPHPTELHFGDSCSSLNMVVWVWPQNSGWSLQIVQAPSCIFAVMYIFSQTRFTHVPTWHFVSSQSTSPTTTGHPDGQYNYTALPPPPPPSLQSWVMRWLIEILYNLVDRGSTRSNFGKRWKSKQNTHVRV